jgi:4-hydroxybenzoate polyprenyltransferase
MRPANIITAVADILAGVAIAGSITLFHSFDLNAVLMLVISTAFLYGGGVVLNDVFDADLDKIERPERPIPSGLIDKSAAALFGIILLLGGIAAAAFSHAHDLLSLSTLLATIIAIAAVVYDKWMKHHAFLGPLTMGFCRGCNLLLGMSILAGAVELSWFLAVVPVMYIFAITMISRGEVHGGSRSTLYIAALLYILVVAALLLVSFYMETMPSTLPFAAFFVFMIFIPLQKAINKPEASRIGKAVKSGVISLIILDATWAAAVGNWKMALMIIVLLPVSIGLARLFAVT